MSLKKELCSCHYSLVDSQPEGTRHKVINYAMGNINDAKVDEKLDHFLNNLKCGARMNLAFGFILKNIEEGGFR